MRFAVAQVARRRANQFRDFVGVLKLRTIHLDNRAWVAEQYFGRGFHNAGFAGTGRTKKQQITNWPPRRVQPRAEHLIQVHQRLYALFLADDLRAKRSLKVAGFVAANGWIQLLPDGWSHCAFPLAEL